MTLALVVQSTHAQHAPSSSHSLRRPRAAAAQARRQQRVRARPADGEDGREREEADGDVADHAPAVPLRDAVVHLAAEDRADRVADAGRELEDAVDVGVPDPPVALLRVHGELGDEAGDERGDEEAWDA
jgi:hypothetical protein